MLDVSIAEIMLILLVALLILGPERLPRVARTLGHWVGRARAAFNHIRDELDREAFNQDMQERFRGQLRDMGLDEESLRREQQDMLPPYKDEKRSGDEKNPRDEKKDVHDDSRSGGDSGERRP